MGGFRISQGLQHRVYQPGRGAQRLAFLGVGSLTLTLVTNDLDQDPPVVVFRSSQSGTAYLDIDSGASAPAPNTGDIGSIAVTLTAGVDSDPVDLSAYSGVTGYFYIGMVGASSIALGEYTIPITLTLIQDNLTADPPSYTFSSTAAGTATWEFHSTTTYPGAGSGDIASGSFAVVAGANEASINLVSYASETGYLHFKVGDSNVLTSQVITVPSGETVEQDLGAISGVDWTPTDATISGDILTATLQSGAQTPKARRGSVSVTAPGDYTLIFDIEAMSASVGDTGPYTERRIHVDLYSMDTSPSPLSAEYDMTDGSIPNEDNVGMARTTALGGGLYTCEFDFTVTSDGVGVLDIGMAETTFDVIRLVDPDGTETVTITNARIIVR